MKRNTRALALGALIAALYVAITYAFAWCSFGPIQLRPAELLTVLPYCMPVAIPALTIGCFAANLLSALGPLDLVLGTGATALAACLTALCRKKGLLWLAPLPPVVLNALCVGFVIVFQAGTVKVGAWALSALSVGIGQAICCYGLGLPLLFFLKQRENSLQGIVTFSHSKK